MKTATYKVSGSAFAKDPEEEMSISFHQKDPDPTLPRTVEFTGSVKAEAVPFLMGAMGADVEIEFDDDLHPVLINGKRSEEIFDEPLSILLGLHTSWLNDEILDAPVIS